MAECHQSTGDAQPCRIESELPPEECTELGPLILPQGVTPYIAARLTTSILMRRAYCSTCPWTQWLLLASVGILHGQATPTLDSITLHLLQRTMNEKLASSGDVSGGAEDDTNSFERGNTADAPDSVAAVPSTENLKDGDLELGSTFNVEPSPTSKKCSVTEEERRGKIDNLEKENAADDTTLPFTGDSRNADRSLLEPSPNSKKCTVTEDKNALEISLMPLKNSTPKPSSIPPTQSYLGEHEKSFNVTHYSPKDCHLTKEKQYQQTSSGSLKVDEMLSSPKENNPNEKNCIKASQNHHKKYCLPDDNNLSVELSHTSEKHSLIKDVRSSETVNTSCVSPCALVQQKSIALHVNPRKLGILSTKWVQVKGPRQIDVGVQADASPSYETEQLEKCDTEIHMDICAVSPPKTFANKEAQTVMKIKRDKSSQTGNEDMKEEKQPSQPLWNIISLSDLPQRKKHFASGKKSKTKNNANDGHGECKDLHKGLEGRSTEKSTLKGMLFFHGRPMLKSKTKPLEIPLDAVVSLLDPAFQDPRLWS